MHLSEGVSSFLGSCNTNTICVPGHCSELTAAGVVWNTPAQQAGATMPIHLLHCFHPLLWTRTQGTQTSHPDWTGSNPLRLGVATSYPTASHLTANLPSPCWRSQTDEGKRASSFTKSFSNQMLPSCTLRLVGPLSPHCSSWDRGSRIGWSLLPMTQNHLPCYYTVTVPDLHATTKRCASHNHPSPLRRTLSLGMLRIQTSILENSLFLEDWHGNGWWHRLLPIQLIWGSLVDFKKKKNLILNAEFRD